MSVRSQHFRRHQSATRPTESALGEFRAAEALEDRTLLSGVTGIDGRDDLLIEKIGLTEDGREGEFSEWEQFVVSVVEAQLAVAETADLEPSVEPRDHFGDVRLAAHAFHSLQVVLDEYGLNSTDVWLEIVSVEWIPDDLELDLQTDGLGEDAFHDVVSDLNWSDASLLAEIQVVAEVSDFGDATSESLLVTIGVLWINDLWNPESAEEPGDGGFKIGEMLPDFDVVASLDPIVAVGSSGNRLSNGFLPDVLETITSHTSDPAASDANSLLARRDEIAANTSSSFVPIAIVAPTTADMLVPAKGVNDGRERVESDDVASSVFGEHTAPASTATVFEAGLETWDAEEVGFAVSTTLVAGAVGSVETQMLLEGVNPVELSGVVTEPLQPVIGLAGSLVLVLQTVGRTALLAVFGEGGTGPMAEFVEPMIDLAEIGTPPERWELKIVDSVVSGPIAQAVSSDRHFEIRNIGPAANLEGALPDVATLTLLTLPRHGVLEHVGATQNVFRYVPDPGFSGVDEFRYRLKTASGESHEGQLIINVPTTSSPTGLRTATRDIELRLEVDRNVAAMNNAFEDFEDWRGGLD